MPRPAPFSPVIEIGVSLVFFAPLNGSEKICAIFSRQFAADKTGLFHLIQVIFRHLISNVIFFMMASCP